MLSCGQLWGLSKYAWRVYSFKNVCTNFMFETWVLASTDALSFKNNAISSLLSRVTLVNSQCLGLKQNETLKLVQF